MFFCIVKRNRKIMQLAPALSDSDIVYQFDEALTVKSISDCHGSLPTTSSILQIIRAN